METINTDKKEVQSQNTGTKGAGGFITMIVLIIVILIIASFYGFGPQVILNEFILPVVSFIWGVIVWVVNLLVGLIKSAINAFNTLVRIFR